MKQTVRRVHELSWNRDLLLLVICIVFACVFLINSSGEWECVEWSKKNIIGYNITFDNNSSQIFNFNCDELLLRHTEDIIIEVNDKCAKSIRVKR